VEGFAEAQREGGDWLRQHGEDGISRWMACAAQVARPMKWDHDYQHNISKREF